MSDLTNNNQLHSNGSSYEGRGYRGQNFPGDNQTGEDEIDLKQLFYSLWHNKWIIVITVFAASIIAGAYSYTLTPIYQSEASLLISQSQNRYSYAGSDLANLLTSTYGIGTGSTIANELQILRSRKLSLEMADSLMQNRLMENGRQFPVLFKAYPEDSALTIRDTVAMRLRNNIAFSQVDREADLVQISYSSPSPLEAAYITNLTIDLYTDLSTRQNRAAANSAVTFLAKERNRIEDRLNEVEQRLRNFMNEKQLVQIDAQTEGLITRMAELESQRQEARVKLVTVNSAIKQYEERLNEIKPGLADQYANAIGPNMARLQYELAELRTEKMLILAKNPGIENIASPPKELQDIDNQIQVYEKEIKKQTSDLIDKSDQYLGFLGGRDGNIAQSVGQLNQKLIELQVEQRQYQSQVEVLNEQLDEQETFFENLPDNMIDLARLKRDVTINEELFLTVSKQYAEMSLWEQTQFGLGRPVDSGYIPEKPVSPNKKLFVLVGFILGGILSVGYIFIREAFNNTIDGVEKLRRFNYPLLSVIPKMGDYLKKEHNGKERVQIQGRNISTSLITLFDTISPISESFRRLESNIIYSNPDQKLRSIMVTSSTKGEGKTTVSSNLGIVLAEAGYKVCIVDTDLRRPNLHNVFGLNRVQGLNEVLFDGLNLEEAIQDTVLDNLNILSSGRRPPNPSAITQSKAFLELIEELEEKFEYLIIDTAPFGIITDASALIKQTDGVVLVTQFGSTTDAEVRHTIENLERLNAGIIGTVLSGFDYRESTDYHYGDRYYHNVYQDYANYHKD